MRGRSKTFLGILVVIGLVIWLHNLNATRFIENSFRFFINNSAAFIYQTTLKLHVNAVKNEDATKLKESYHELLTKLRAYEADGVKLKLLEEENENLRAELRFFTSTTYNHVGADVIGRTIDPIGTTIIIDRGSESGIAINNPVITGNGWLVGKIARVEQTTAIVRLINDNQSKVAATAMNMVKSIGLVEGGYGISVRMNFIPQNEIIKFGDIVITSGLERGVPRGLIIGTVEVVEKKPQEPFQQAILKTAANLHTLTSLSIITSASGETI